MTVPPRPVRWALGGARLALLGYVATILVGAFLLTMPFARLGAPHRLVDDLFTATSAVCVTGLMTIDLGTSYSPVGLAVIAALVQVGGLGTMTLFSLTMLMVGKRLSMRDRLNLREVTEQPGLAGLATHVRGIVAFMLGIEALGLVVLATQTVPEFGWGAGLGIAGFFAVCGPNNAGFSMFPDGLARWQGNPVLLLTLASLTIVGGLGYGVARELLRRFLLRSPPDFRANPMIAIVVGGTVLLLAGATVALWAFEHANPRTFGPMDPATQWLNAFFMAVQPRTSGFNSVETGAMAQPSLLLLVPLMFIGTGPGGTGGGLKLTTAAVLLSSVWAVARGLRDVPLPGLRRRVADEVVLKATTALCLSLTFVGTATFAITALEGLPLLPVLFEVVSAFATAGLSMGITAQLGDASKLILVGTLIVGRLGSVMLLLALFPGRQASPVRFQEERLTVG